MVHRMGKTFEGCRDFGKSQTDLQLYESDILASTRRDYKTTCRPVPPYAQCRAQPPLRPDLHEIVASANQAQTN